VVPDHPRFAPAQIPLVEQIVVLHILEFRRVSPVSRTEIWTAAARISPRGEPFANSTALLDKCCVLRHWLGVRFAAMMREGYWWS
jgi:hypothetical protein